MRVIDSNPAVHARAMRSARGISCAVAIAIAFGMPAIFVGVPSLAGEGNQNTMMNPGAPEPKPEPEPPKANYHSCSKAKQKRLAWLRQQIELVPNSNCPNCNNLQITNLNVEMAQLRGQCE
jgi:hypothetical protein